LPNCIAAFPRLRIGHFHINYPTFTITGNAYQKCRHLSIQKSQPEIAARATSRSCSRRREESHYSATNARSETPHVVSCHTWSYELALNHSGELPILF
jgi:hypothetical protein